MVAVLVGLSVLVAVDTTEELIPVADCASATDIPFHLLGNAIENNSTWMSILGTDTNSRGRCIYILYTPRVHTHVKSCLPFLLFSLAIWAFRRNKSGADEVRY